MIDPELGNAFIATASTIAAAGKGQLLILALLNIFLGFSMNKLLSAVRSLGTITHLMIMQLYYPALVVLVYKHLIEYVTFDIIPTEDIYSETF